MNPCPRTFIERERIAQYDPQVIRRAREISDQERATESTITQTLLRLVRSRLKPH